MKKIIGIILMLLLIVSVQGAIVPRDTALSVTLINQEPDPVRPGEYLTLRFRVENYGEMAANNVAIELKDQYPFSLDPGIEAVRNIGTLGPIQRGNLGVMVEYKVRVAGDAANGKTPLTISYGQNNRTSQSVKFDIEVRTRETGLEISAVKTSSEYLVPGNVGYIEIRVNNPSDLTVRDVTLKLDLVSENIPLAPYDGATIKTINFLNPGDQGNFRFGVVPFSDASAKVYKIPVEITFLNAENELETRKEIIGIRIGSIPDLSVSVNTNDFYSENKIGRVTISIINKGVSDVKFADIVMLNTDDYEVISSSETYIGNIDSDDFETSDYTILRKNTKTNFPIVFKLEYRDAHNSLYGETLEVPLTLYSASLWKNGGSRNGIIVVILILGIAGYFAYKHFKKKKKNA
jgi:hypothetical protein